MPEQNGTVVRQVRPEDLTEPLAPTRGVQPGQIPPMASGVAVTLFLGVLGLAGALALSKRR